MQELIAQVINGLSLGSIYVLLVTGFNLLLLVAMIIHFSYPQVVVFSMYITWSVLQLTGNNLALGIAAGVASSIVLNLASAPLFQKVMSKRGEVDINATMVLSMGIGMIITDVLSHSFNEGLPVAFPDSLSSITPHRAAGPDQRAGGPGLVPGGRHRGGLLQSSSSCTRRAPAGRSAPSRKTPTALAW